MKTFQQTIDNLADYPILPQSDCGVLIIFEDNQLGTHNIKVKDAQGGPYITFPAGEFIDMSRVSKAQSSYRKGEGPVGYVQTDAGSITLSQYER